MRTALLAALLTFSAVTHALIEPPPQETNGLTNPIGAIIVEPMTKLKQEASDATKNAWTEAGLMVHSIGEGTNFINLALGNDFTRRFAMGLRALLPLASDTAGGNENVFLAQLTARYYMVNSENKFFLEPAITQGLTDAGNAFAMVGIVYGYHRQINSEWGLGANAGVDYMPSDESAALVGSPGTKLHSKLGIVGSFNF